ncbi:HAD hydrolase-like protein [Paenibacillus xylaniclasticus]|uniref:HAD hydrolase-like protein n=1 Tax=Paenibacillus xylaniclasticus TaxID=588083 RepID=UPI000FDA82A0|nr:MULTISPECIES: HAD hydrolase-like protein [Paenibacillus]GFN30268.1 2-haloalkanoic acid dehalogenase [Paenibacillus curdlanolyticus]
MTKVRAIFFDFDGVLTLDATGSKTTCRYLSKVTGLPFDEVMKAYRSFNDQLQLGNKSHADIWEELGAMLHGKLEERHLIESFDSTPMNMDMLALARELKEQGYMLGIITDNKKDRMHYLYTLHRLDHIFDTTIISAEVGSNKQHRQIFDIALESLQVEPYGSVFIDNKESNLIVPRKLGMAGIYHLTERTMWNRFDRSYIR